MDDLKARLHALGLVATAKDLDEVIATATKKRWGAVELLEHVVALESYPLHEARLGA